MDRLTGKLVNPLAGSFTAVERPPSPASGAAEAHGSGAGFQYAASALPGRLQETRFDDGWLLCIGAPYSTTGATDAAEALRQVAPNRESILCELGGEFALARFDTRERTLMLATDLFGSIPLYYQTSDDGQLAFGTDFEWVSRQVPGRSRLDPQAIFDYLFFSVVPGNRSILTGVRKVPPASVFIIRDGRVQVSRWWTPRFPRNRMDSHELRERMRSTISEAVGRVATLPDVGCFLSGGLDSSTVCGMAAKKTPGKVRAFTIGFDIPQFDETAYARITARHFGINLHEHRIHSDDISACVDRVTNGFPEPFGNPSAIPAYLCANFARSAGVRHLLAGDGGDEIFAGNERYQKQSVFNLYGNLPPWIRQGTIDPMAAVSAVLPGPLGKLASYVRQARVPLPDRLYSYNLLVRNRPEAVLTDDFLRTVDTESPYQYVRSIYQEPEDGDPLDRMLYLDWTTTLTDNDLMKVRLSAELAGVTVHFPLLDPAVVSVSTRIPSAAKLTLTELRKCYKETFRDFLPRDVIRKHKHGFGVPVGIWLNNDRALRDRVNSRLTSLASRNIVRPELILELLSLQAGEHASYYGSLVWPLFALEQWLQNRGF